MTTRKGRKKTRWQLDTPADIPYAFLGYAHFCVRTSVLRTKNPVIDSYPPKNGCYHSEPIADSQQLHLNCTLQIMVWREVHSATDIGNVETWPCVIQKNISIRYWNDLKNFKFLETGKLVKKKTTGRHSLVVVRKFFEGTPWKMNMLNLKTTQLKRNIFHPPTLLCSMLIFRG